jgi:polyhydroxyalkanoate synthesis regulator phasin
MVSKDDVQRYLDAGIAFTAVTRARAEELVGELVKSGTFQSTDARAKVDDLIERSRKSREALVAQVRSEVTSQLSSLGITSLDDLAREVADIVNRTAEAGRAAADKVPGTKSGSTTTKPPHATAAEQPLPPEVATQPTATSTARAPKATKATTSAKAGTAKTSTAKTVDAKTSTAKTVDAKPPAVNKSTTKASSAKKSTTKTVDAKTGTGKKSTAKASTPKTTATRHAVGPEPDGGTPTAGTGD